MGLFDDGIFDPLNVLDLMVMEEFMDEDDVMKDNTQKSKIKKESEYLENDEDFENDESEEDEDYLDYEEFEEDEEDDDF